MATIIIDTQSNEAKKMVEYLKSTTYARVIDDLVPNEETIRAMNQVSEGTVNAYKSAKEMMDSLKKASDVQD